MTKAEKDFCESCARYGICGFVIRKAERACGHLQDFSDGYEAAIANACDWWHIEFFYPSMTPEERDWYNKKIEEFKKAMLEDE